MSKECLSNGEAAVKLLGTGAELGNELVTKDSCINSLSALSTPLQKYTSDFECPPDDDIIPEIWITNENSRYLINQGVLQGNTCINCGVCIKVCPAEAIDTSSGETRIISSKCINCGECLARCIRAMVIAGPLACTTCNAPIVVGLEELYHGYMIRSKDDEKATYWNYRLSSSITCAFCGTSMTAMELFNYWG